MPSSSSTPAAPSQGKRKTPHFHKAEHQLLAQWFGEAIFAESASGGVFSEGVDAIRTVMQKFMAGLEQDNSKFVSAKFRAVVDARVRELQFKDRE